MAQLPDQQWIIEVNSRPTGPFSIDQIRGLLKERQILPSFKVRKKSQGNESWISIEELLKSIESFSAPPRPQSTESGVTQIHTQRTGLKNDPTENLFETIQSIKEKTTFIQRPSTKVISSKIRNRWGGPILILFGITITALGFTLWSAFKIVQLSQNPKAEGSPKPTPWTTQATIPTPVPKSPTPSARPERPTSQQRVTLPSSASEGGQIQIISEQPQVQQRSAVESGRARPKERAAENRSDEESNFEEELPLEDASEERDQINNEGVAPNPVDSE